MKNFALGNGRKICRKKWGRRRRSRMRGKGNNTSQWIIVKTLRGEISKNPLEPLDNRRGGN